MERTSDRKKQIIVQASSYGPYLWKSDDVDRAILWLKGEDAGQTHQFLRLLLQSRGSLRKRKHSTAFGSDMQVATSSESSTLLESIVEGYLKLSPNPDLEKPVLALDMCDIAVQRAITADAYDLAVSLSSFMGSLAYSNDSNAVKCPLGYFRSPGTIIRSDYASQLFERLVILFRNEEKEVKKEETVTGGYLIEKLSELSIYDARICEVFMLMLLEPFSNPCKGDDGNPINRSKIHKSFEKKVTEKLVASILQFATESDKSPLYDNSRNWVNGATRILLWTVPNQLICSVCDLHPDVCGAYVSYLLLSTMSAYCLLLRELATNASKAAGTNEENFEKPEIAIMGQRHFHDCVLRLKYLKEEATEKSVAILTNNFNAIVSKRTGMFVENEHNNTSHHDILAQQLLALGAIAKELCIDIERLL
mmetsp:Transcript_26559/g.41196  ORF Transcript_26559/g.41196 Transcript_26559/m.41196 type:complete len:421 (-) Transcript_26559:234-1496(-)